MSKPTSAELDVMPHAEFKRRFMTPVLLTHESITERMRPVSVEDEGDHLIVALKYRYHRSPPSKFPYIRTWS